MVKVRRPGIEEQVALDLDVLRSTVRFLHKRSETAQLLQLEALADELEVHLRAELDLREEAHNTEVVGRAIADFQELLVANVVHPHVTEEVLILERIHGKKVAVCPVLRAGVGMLDGVLSLVSSARVGFIGMYRDEETLEPVEYYAKLPADVADRDEILLDPMLATGNSTAAAADTVKRAGATSVRLIAIIAAPEGIERIHRDHPDVQIVVAAIDRGLNERGYIVPGLGDAGDRLYGTK